MLAVNWLGFLEASHLCEGPGPGFHGMMDLLAVNAGSSCDRDDPWLHLRLEMVLRPGPSLY